MNAVGLSRANLFIAKSPVCRISFQLSNMETQTEKSHKGRKIQAKYKLVKPNKVKFEDVFQTQSSRKIYE